MKIKKELYAVHQDGRKLYLPCWNGSGEVVKTKYPTVAVTVDSAGKTFPEGSAWIRGPRSWTPLAGWTLAEGEDFTASRKKRSPNAKYLSTMKSPKSQH